MATNNVFGDMLRRLRVKYNKRLSDAAASINVSLVHVSDVERGKRNPFRSDQIGLLGIELGFSNSELRELKEAAMMVRGTVIESTRPAQAKAAYSLARMWDSLTDQQLNEIRRVVRDEESE